MPNGVLIFAEFRGSSIKRVTYEMVSAAKPLATALGGPVQVAFLGGGGLAGNAQPIFDAGVGNVITAESADLAAYAVESYTDAVQQIVAATQPAVVMMAATPRGRDLAPRVAARLDSVYAADITGI